MQTGGLTLIYLGFACILVFALRTQIPAAGWGAVIVKRLAAVGYYSYSIYLWHLLVAFVMPWVGMWLARLHRPLLDAIYQYAHFPLYICLALALGIMMARLIELPVLAIRDRVFPSRSTPLSVPAAEPSLAVTAIAQLQPTQPQPSLAAASD